MHRTKENFDKCIRDYLEAVARFPNVCNQLIRWLCTTKKPTFMLMYEFMRRQVQHFCYNDGGYLHQTMELPIAQEKSKQIFLAQPKAHQYKFSETNKTVPTDLLWLIAFFEQCQTADKVTGILDKIKEKEQPKEKKTAYFLAARSHDSIVARTTTTIKATYVISMTNNMTVAIETINTKITLIAKTRTTRTKSPTRRRMIASAISSRKRVTRPCTTTSPFHQAWTLCPEKESLLFKISFLLLLPFLLMLEQQQYELHQSSCVS
jgi:hypothetical protein